MQTDRAALVVGDDGLRDAEPFGHLCLRETGNYRRKEKSIGLPVIIHDENFFNRSDLERRRFLKDVILEKLALLAKVVKRNKLDTDIELLKSDVESLSF